MEKIVTSISLRKVRAILARFVRQDAGVTSIEYGLLVGFLGIAIVNILYITRSSAEFPLLSVYSDVVAAVNAAA